MVLARLLNRQQTVLCTPGASHRKSTGISSKKRASIEDALFVGYLQLMNRCPRQPIKPCRFPRCQPGMGASAEMIPSLGAGLTCTAPAVFAGASVRRGGVSPPSPILPRAPVGSPSGLRTALPAALRQARLLPISTSQPPPIPARSRHQQSRRSPRQECTNAPESAPIPDVLIFRFRASTPTGGVPPCSNPHI
jgi:hypothetical protein